jgi:hypothetical protein
MWCRLLQESWTPSCTSSLLLLLLLLPFVVAQGLIPRATELLKLGGSVFLAFAPFILAISVLFGGIYLTFGDSFVHGGDRNAGPPAYVDPEVLLSEPTVDPFIPFQ